MIPAADLDNANNASTSRYSNNSSSMSSTTHYQIPGELQELLLDFTVQYLIEQPNDIVDFALHYFGKVKDKRDGLGGETNGVRMGNREENHQSDESMLSEDENGEICFSAIARGSDSRKKS